jgi:tetratricopeptide (TPR) repeat protein
LAVLNAKKSPGREYVVYAVLALGTAVLYLPVLHFGFLFFDDPVYVSSNPHVFGGVSWKSVGWAFGSFYAANWHPVTWVSHMLDCQVFGYQAGWHHFVSAMIHVMNTLLVYRLFRGMTGTIFRSAFVAGLFAWHPLHVESVAWIAERKDVLSTFFGLLALGCYWRFSQRKPGNGIRNAKSEIRKKEESRKPKGEGKFWYAFALLFFALGLMSKPMLVTLPFVFLLMDYWPLQRFDLKRLANLLLEKVPFLMLSVADSIVTMAAQKHGEAVVDTAALPAGARLANAAIAYAGYLRKTFWPVDLAAYYPYEHSPSGGEVAVAILVLVIISALVVRFRRRAPYLPFGWLWFLGTLVPVIGLVQVGGQSMADRYTYLPLVGVFVMCVWGGADLMGGLPHAFLIRAAVSAGCLGACFAATLNQENYWRDTVSLFTRDLELFPVGNAMAHHCLGRAYFGRGDNEAAIREYQELARLLPNSSRAQLSLGECFEREGKAAEAIEHYREALVLDPHSAEVYKSLGGCLASQMKLDEARTNFLKAIELKPDYAEAYMRLATAEMAQGDTSAGVEHLKRAVEIFPAYPEPHYYLAHALEEKGDWEGAGAHFEAAIRSNPLYVEAMNDFARLLVMRPKTSDNREAQGMELARKACELTNRTNAACLETLGAALSRTGQFDEASQTIEAGIRAARAQANAEAAARMQTQLTLCRKGQLYPLETP